MQLRRGSFAAAAGRGRGGGRRGRVGLWRRDLLPADRARLPPTSTAHTHAAVEQSAASPAASRRTSKLTCRGELRGRSGAHSLPFLQVGMRGLQKQRAQLFTSAESRSRQELKTHNQAPEWDMHLQIGTPPCCAPPDAQQMDAQAITRAPVSLHARLRRGPPRLRSLPCSLKNAPC